MHSLDRARQSPTSAPEQRVARRRDTASSETFEALAGMPADSPLQSQLQLRQAMDRSPRVTAQAKLADEINRRSLDREADLRQLPRDVAASPQPPVAQRVVRDKLPNGTLVVVDGGAAVGTTIAETEDGYRVEVGGEKKSFTYDQLDIPPSLTSNKGEGWLTAEAHGLREMAISLITDVPPEQYAYIAIGNSPALLMNYVAAWAQNDPKAFPVQPLILELPLSTGELTAYMKNMRDPEAMQHVTQYFAQYVAPQKLEGRRPALIDWAASGKTLALVRLHLMQYYKEIGAAAAAAGMELVTIGESDVSVKMMESELVAETFEPLEPVLAEISTRELTAAMQEVRGFLENPAPALSRYVDATLGGVLKSLSITEQFVGDPEATLKSVRASAKLFVNTRIVGPLERAVKGTDLGPLVSGVRKAGGNPSEQMSALQQLLARRDEIAGYTKSAAIKTFQEYVAQAEAAYAMVLPYFEHAHPQIEGGRALSAANKPNPKAYIEGLSSRKFKTDFEYSPFRSAPYADIARGEIEHGATDAPKLQRTIEAAQTIFSLLL